jgi:queuine tRNA-ribosyltransferase
VDFFDCVMPARNGRHGLLYTSQGPLHIKNARYEKDDRPPDILCGCLVCARYSRAYLRHLFKAQEMLAMRLGVMHNLFFYHALMREIRAAIMENRFNALYERMTRRR